MRVAFAWDQYRDPWMLEVTAAGEQEHLEVDASSRRIIATDASWTTAELSLRLSTVEDIDVSVTAIVLVSSPSANLRMPIVLQADGDRCFVGTAVLHRSVLAGVVSLEGQIFTTAEAPRLVGWSDPWTLVVHAGTAPPRPGAPPIDIQFLAFGDDGSPDLLRNASASYCVVDTSETRPVVYVNDEIQGLQKLLLAERPQKERNRLQKVLSTSIAKQALAAMLREAQAQIEVEDDGSVQLPADSAYLQVLQVVADEAKSFDGIDELCRFLADPAEFASLDRTRSWVEIESVLDRLTNHSELVASSVEEVRYV